MYTFVTKFLPVEFQGTLYNSEGPWSKIGLTFFGGPLAKNAVEYWPHYKELLPNSFDLMKLLSVLMVFMSLYWWLDLGNNTWMA